MDGSNLSERYRERLYRIADKLNVNFILVRVEASPEAVSERLRLRQDGEDSGNKSDAGREVYLKGSIKCLADIRERYCV